MAIEELDETAVPVLKQTTLPNPSTNISRHEKFNESGPADSAFIVVFRHRIVLAAPQTTLGGAVKRIKIAMAAAAAVAISTTSLQAQTCGTDATATVGAATVICQVGVSATATVHDVMRLTLGSVVQDLGAPNEANYGAGYKDATGTSATIKSNRPWKVTVAAAGAFGYAPNGSGLTRTPKAATDLLWGTVSGTYGNNMGTSATMASGTTGTAGAAAQAQIFYRTNWFWATDIPGSYDITLNFTLSTP